MSDKAHAGWQSFAWFVAIVVLLVLIDGEPDILDGWAKRLNDTTCVE